MISKFFAVCCLLSGSDFLKLHQGYMFYSISAYNMKKIGCSYSFSFAVWFLEMNDYEG